MLSKHPQGKLIVIVAPSGAGKTTIANKLLEQFPRIKFSVSATTRSPRKDEKNGTDYFFLSNLEFDENIDNKGFLEWEEYSGNRYGTLRAEVEKLMKKSYFPLLDIEVKGALNVKKMYAEDCVGIFIQPPSIKELKRRLLSRGSETKESLDKRLKRAEHELMYANHFDFVVTNDDLNTAYKQVKTIVKSFTGKPNN
jgi:guanylate kinase